MGITYVEGRMKGPTGREEVRFLIDSGARYTLARRRCGESLGLHLRGSIPSHSPMEEQSAASFQNATSSYPKEKHTSPVIPGEADDEPLLGVVTLEILGLASNPSKRRLEPMRTLLMKSHHLQ
ncbi:MAG: aspartyl protease [Nitrososphaerales archaeon]